MTEALNVSIIGCGIAGTLAARVLREKHNVTVFERFQKEHELAAAINIGPNAAKILEQYGFSNENARSIGVRSTLTLTSDGHQLRRDDLPDLRKQYGAEWQFQHRNDLWYELFRLATAPSEDLNITGNPTTIVWGAEVVDVDVESGDVKFADGKLFKSDLVIGADGIKSVVRKLVVGEAAFSTARPSGSSAFRFLLPREVVNEVAPDLSLMDRANGGQLRIHLSLRPHKRSLIMYPCRDFEFLNFGCIAPDAFIGVPTTESWSSESTLEDLLRCFGDFNSVQSLLERAKNIKLCQLRDQDPLPTYVKGRTILIGDAAHAMTPY